jgi:hypothetical protein
MDTVGPCRLSDAVEGYGPEPSCTSSDLVYTLGSSCSRLFALK